MKGEGEEQVERLLEVKDIIEEILEEVNAFTELKEMLHANSTKLRAVPSPPDRCKEMDKIKKEIRRGEKLSWIKGGGLKESSKTVIITGN